LNVKVKGQGH